MVSDHKYAQMLRVATLYYERNLGQQQIAEIMGCSNSTVSRLLVDAREAGIIEIKIHSSVSTNAALATQLCETFGLRDAIVVMDSANNLKNVGKAAAEFFLSIVGDHTRVGVTWGITLLHMLQAIEPASLNGVEIVQLSGTLGHDETDIDGANLVMRLAEKLQGTYRLMPAPTVVDDVLVRDKLVEQSQIRQVLDLARSADVIYQGIGALEDTMSSLVRAGYLSEDERQNALALGAVGHVVGRMIDINGNEVTDFNERVIGLSLPDLREMDWSVGITASSLKASAILGALRGRYINALVIEETSAREVLRLADLATA